MQQSMIGNVSSRRCALTSGATPARQLRISAPVRGNTGRAIVVKVSAAGKGFSKKADAEREARKEAKKPTKEQRVENAANDKYDEIVKSGGEVYAAFARLKGPGPGPDGKCQWFPVGPIAVEKPSQIEKALWDAEKPLVAAVKKMYPQIFMKSVETGLEIGYRVRDAPQMSEAEIKAGGDPFDNVIPLVSPDDRTISVSAPNPVAQAFSNFEKLFTGKN